jgi:hypothetical protein
MSMGTWYVDTSKVLEGDNTIAVRHALLTFYAASFPMCISCRPPATRPCRG